MKRLPRPDPSDGEAARLGEQLRDARMALGMSIDDMAANLRIRRVYLAALELGEVRELPAPAYVLGFVRSYARALGLDDDDMVRRFRESATATPHRRVDLVFPEPVPERGIPAGAVVLAGIVLVVGAYTAWFQWSGSATRTVDTVPPMPARLEQVVREAAPSLADPPPTPSGMLPGGMSPGGMANGSADPVGAPRLVSVAPALAAGSNASAATPPVAPRAAPVPGESRILLRARADTWISLRDRATNQSVVARLLKAGESLPVPPREGLQLTAGFAPGLEIMVDGVAAPGFPASGGSRREILMDPERLKAGTAVPTPEAPAAGATSAPAAASAPRPAARPPAPAAARRPVRPEDAAFEPPRQ